jgi:beta-phosphoglucomutase
LKIDACIFDLDGVITDTAGSHFRSWKAITKELGIDFTEELNERLKGIGRRESLMRILDWGKVKLSEEQIVDIMFRKNEVFQDYIIEITAADVFAGMDPFLRELKDAGIQIGLGSSSMNARAILTQLRITHYFDVIIDGNDVAKTKPDPEVFLSVSRALGILPANSVVFEDAESGVQAARSGGFSVVGVGHGEALAQADHIIPGFSDFSLARLKALFSLDIINS